MISSRDRSVSPKLINKCCLHGTVPNHQPVRVASIASNFALRRGIQENRKIPKAPANTIDIINPVTRTNPDLAVCGNECNGPQDLLLPTVLLIAIAPCFTGRCQSP